MAKDILYDPLRLHLPPNVTSAMARGGVGQHVFEARKDLQGPEGITTALNPHSTTTDGTRQEALKARATHAWMQQPTTRMPSTTGVCRQDYSTTTTCDQR